MKPEWFDLGRNAEQRAEAEFRSLKIPLRHRIDAVLIGLVLAIFVIFVLGWLVGVIAGEKLGFFEKPLIRPVEDPRILMNVRDNIGEKTIQDAVYHVSEGAIYLSQTGGFLHRYNPAAGIWSTETPFSNPSTQQMVNPEVIMLRSGCGSDPLSNRVGHCRDGDSLWGLTANNGLVRRSGGQWQVVKSDSVFIGAGGKPVGEGQMTSAAVSLDREWLVVGTRRDGIGVYHLKTHRWVPLEPEFFQLLPNPSVTHVVFCSGSFWLGGPGGLARLFIDSTNHHPVLEISEDIYGSILDLDVDPQQRLWVLERGLCRGGGRNCLRISRFGFQYPNQPPELLLEEQNLFPGLTLDDLQFARYWENRDRLILAGSAGIYSYDLRLHNWERHFRGVVTTLLPYEQGQGFYFGYNGGIGVVAEQGHQPWNKPDKRCSTWMMPGSYAAEKIMMLGHGSYSSREDLLALGLSGKLFSLDKEDIGLADTGGPPNTGLRVVFEGERASMSPNEFTSATAFGDIVLFTGGRNAKNVLAHNIITRSYKNVPLNSLPGWIRQPRLSMVTSGRDVYAVVQQERNAHIYHLAEADAAAANFGASANEGIVSGNANRVRDWDGRGIGLLTDTGGGDGRLFRFAPRKQALIGMHALEMNYTTFRDAAAYNDGIVVATDEGVRYYNYTTRTWSKYHRLPGNESAAEVVYYRGSVLVRTNRGSLMELPSRGSFNRRIGAPTGFDISDSQVSDALEKHGDLFIGGNGKINRYDLAERRVVERWDLPCRGSVKLIDIVNSRPLTLCSGTAFIGDKALDPSAGTVVSLTTADDFIWTVRNTGSHRYLKRYPAGNPFSQTAKCYFYRPYSGAKRIYDAAVLNDGSVVVSTEKGVRFYSPAARSWHHHVLRDPIPAGSMGGRIFGTSDHLVFAARKKDSVQLTLVDKHSLYLPPSCSNEQVLVGGEVRNVRAYTMDPGGARMAYIQQDGTVTEWLNGIELDRLPGSNKTRLPESRFFKRFFSSESKGTPGIPEYLYFTAAAMVRNRLTFGPRIYRYNLTMRSWLEVPLLFSKSLKNDNISDVTIEKSGQQSIVIVKTHKGHFLSSGTTSLAADTAANGVAVKTVFLPSGGIGAKGERLVDVQQRIALEDALDEEEFEEDPGYWTFVFKEGINYYDPRQRQWLDKVILPGLNGSAIKTYARLGNRRIVWVENSSGPMWYVAHEVGDYPLTFARLRLNRQTVEQEVVVMDEKGNIWQFSPGGDLTRYILPNSGNYSSAPAVYETPFIMDPGEVRGAYQWGSRRFVFDTGDGIRVLETTLREELLLPEPAAQLQGIKEIQEEGARLWIRTGSDRLLMLLHRQDNTLSARIFPFKATDLETAVNRLRAQPLGTTIMLENRWAELRQRMAQLPDGRNAFDPILRLSVDKDANRRLVVQRPGGQEILSSSAVQLNPTGGSASTLPLPPSLNVNWIKWSRETHTFAIKTPGSVLVLEPRYFVKDGKFLFEDMDALTLKDEESENRWYAANRHGIWGHSSEDLNLLDPAITYLPMSWDKPVGAAHGLFITGDHGLYTTDGAAAPVSRHNYTLTFGDVTLSESIARAAVSARINTRSSGGEVDVNGFARYGFSWDSNKRGLAYGSTGLLLQSDAGVHPLDSYSGFSSQEIDTLTPNDRAAIDNATWTWRVNNGQWQVSLKNDNRDFKLISTQSGLAFTSDIMKDAAAFGDRLVVISDAFVEYAQPTGQLLSFNARRLEKKPCRRLEVIRGIGGRSDLVLDAGARAGRYLWDTGSGQFKAIDRAGGDLKSRTLVEYPGANPGLRFSRLSSGAVRKEIRLQDVRGGTVWTSFSFTPGSNRFPFDVVTSIATHAGSLYIGTRAGLQVYTVDPGTGLDSGSLVIDMRKKRQGALTAVQKVGEPVNRPGRVIAYSSGSCIEKSGTADVFQECSAPQRLTRRLRVDTPFWQFVENSGRLEGRYKLENSRLSNESPDIRGGRFLHDNVKDFAVYEGQVFTLWTNGWISRHAKGGDMEIGPGVVNFDISSIAPRQFIPVPHDITLGGIAVSGGLYLEGRNRSIWQYSGGHSATPWNEIKDRTVAEAVKGFADHPPIVNRKRLRLLAPKEPKQQGKPLFNFEYRGVDEEWRQLPWESNCVAIDRWTAFIYDKSQQRLWAATPAGLVAFTRDDGGEVVLDPDELRVVPEPVKNGKIPLITHLEAHPGVGSSNRGFPVILKCWSEDGQLVYKGNLDGRKDKDVFTLLQGDDPPGETGESETKKELSEVMVSAEESGFWEWVKTRYGGDKPDRLICRLKGEEVQLVGGRFDFDGINSIAFLQGGMTEIATDAGGWYRLPPGHLGSADSLHISRFRRPEVPGINSALVKEVRTTVTPDGDPVLGLRTSGEGYIRLGKQGITGKTETFQQFQASDGFWQYRKDDDGKLSVTSLKGISSRGSARGVSQRRLEQGRFSDDIVLGFPVSAADERGTYYLLPTGAGILRLDSTLAPSGILAKNALKLEGDNESAPAVLFINSRTQPAQTLYLHRQEFHGLDQPGKTVLELTQHLPEEAVVTAVEEGPQDFIRVRWQASGRQGWTLLEPGSERIEEANSLYANLKELDSGNAESWIRVLLNKQHIECLIHGSAAPFRIELQSPLDLLAAFVNGKSLLVIGKQDLLEINLEKVLLPD